MLENRLQNLHGVIDFSQENFLKLLNMLVIQSYIANIIAYILREQ